MHRLAEDRETLAHRTQDSRFVIHFYPDKICGNKAALVLDLDVQVAWRNICLKSVRTGERGR